MVQGIRLEKDGYGPAPQATGLWAWGVVPRGVPGLFLYTGVAAWAVGIRHRGGRTE